MGQLRIIKDRIAITTYPWVRKNRDAPGIGGRRLSMGLVGTAGEWLGLAFCLNGKCVAIYSERKLQASRRA